MCSVIVLLPSHDTLLPESPGLESYRFGDTLAGGLCPGRGSQTPVCWEQPLLPVWTLFTWTLNAADVKAPPPRPNTQTASLPVGWLALTPWCNRQTEALLL